METKKNTRQPLKNVTATTPNPEQGVEEVPVADAALEAVVEPASASAPVTEAEAETETDLRTELQPYFDAHPGIDKFYVASDGQPFYEKTWAKEHQKSINPAKEVSTVTR